MSKIQLKIFGKDGEQNVMSLREYQKLHKPNTQAVPSKNDLVLVFDDKQPRQKWLLGKITELIPSNDGKIRGAKVILGKIQNVIDQPVNRCYPVETNFQFVLKGDKQCSDQKMKQTVDQNEMLQN